MKIKVQYCWAGGDNFYFRTLACGGVRIPTENDKCKRKHATEMLNILECYGIERKKVRFVHV